MAKPIQMPALSPTMKEGKITKWLKKEGDKVSSGQAIAEVETDKSNLEVESYDDGILLQIAVEEGQSAPVGAPIAFVGQKGEKVEAPAGAPAPAPVAAPAPPAPAAEAPRASPAGGAGTARVVQMPALSPTMKEGKISKWLKKEGDKVSSGQAIAEVETDKSNLELEAYDDGLLLQIAVKEGQSAPVGAPIAYIGKQGDRIPAGGPSAAPAPAEPAPGAPESRPLQVVPTPAAPTAPAPAPAPSARGRIRASPLARKIAREKGLDLAALHGSGPQGRIVKRDVEVAASQPAAAPRPAPKAAPVAPAFGRREPQVLPVSSMRKVIAQRMTEVKPGVPHFYLTVDIEMDAALKIREEAKALDSKVSVNDIIVKAAAVALRRVPRMNVSLQGDRILQFENVDVGIAVSIEDGLITPVIQDADLKGLAQISAESRDLAERARKRALKPHEYTGGSLTVSNLGMYGVDSFIAVINPPQAAIVAVGAVAEKPVARDGQLVVRRMMSACLSGDHRVIDGALGAQYLKELKTLLEHPMRLLF